MGNVLALVSLRVYMKAFKLILRRDKFTNLAKFCSIVVLCLHSCTFFELQLLNLFSDHLESFDQTLFQKNPQSSPLRKK